MTTDVPQGTGRRSRGPFWLAVGVTACWLGVLLFLALRTANPVTVNRWQLLTSDAVVIARPDLTGARGGLVPLRIKKVLAGRDVPDSLRVSEADPDLFRGASSFVVPLTRTPRGYTVTPLPALALERTPRSLVAVPDPSAEKRAPVVYPATDEVLRVTERILATVTQRPYE